jgi:tripartite-type tricarboxylate transporter receptor subunit TctC
VFKCILAAGAALLAVAPMAAAQSYPAKTVRIVVPFAAGGTTDILARVYAQKLSESMGVQFVVDNRGGAGGTIGTDIVAKAPPDGYTINAGSTSSLAVSVSLYQKLPFDINRDLVPVVQTATASIVLASHPSLPAKSIKELIDLSRRRPGEIVYGSSGNGSSLHLCAEYLLFLTKTSMVHVPYKGVGAGMPDFIAGNIQLMFSDMPPFAEYVKVGKLRALGVTTAKRSSLLPDIPAIAETVPGYDLAGWYGIAAPTGTPRDVITRLHSEVTRIMRTPEMKERYVGLAIEPVERTPEEFGVYMKSEIAKWGEIIRRANVKIQ